MKDLKRKIQSVLNDPYVFKASVELDGDTADVKAVIVGGAGGEEVVHKVWSKDSEANVFLKVGPLSASVAGADSGMASWST